MNENNGGKEQLNIVVTIRSEYERAKICLM